MSEEKKPLCPRCKNPISYIDRYKKGDRIYYVAVHYEGYVRVGKKVKKLVRKCHLGPEEYEYATRTHYSSLGIVLEGAVDDQRRVVHYVDTFIRSLSKVRVDKPTLVEIINKLEFLTSKLREQLREECE